MKEIKQFNYITNFIKHYDHYFINDNNEWHGMYRAYYEDKKTRNDICMYKNNELNGCWIWFNYNI